MAQESSHEARQLFNRLWVVLLHADLLAQDSVFFRSPFMAGTDNCASLLTNTAIFVPLHAFSGDGLVANVAGYLGILLLQTGFEVPLLGL